MSFESGSIDNLSCKQCGTEIDAQVYKTTGLCTDCAFDKACPEGWDKAFDKARIAWAK